MRNLAAIKIILFHHRFSQLLIAARQSCVNEVSILHNSVRDNAVNSP